MLTNNNNDNDENDNQSCCSSSASSSDIGEFATLDLTGVDFGCDDDNGDGGNDGENKNNGDDGSIDVDILLRQLFTSEDAKQALKWESDILWKVITENDSNIKGVAVEGDDYLTANKSSSSSSSKDLVRLKELVYMIENGEYINVLCSDSAHWFFSSNENDNNKNNNKNEESKHGTSAATDLEAADAKATAVVGASNDNDGGNTSSFTSTTRTTMWKQIQDQISIKLMSMSMSMIMQTVEDGKTSSQSQNHKNHTPHYLSLLLYRIIEVELIGIAALNLFLQLNYTGPMIDNVDEELLLMHKNGSGGRRCPLHPTNYYYKGSSDNDTTRSENGENKNSEDKSNENTNNITTNNRIFSELAIDGIWPCQVAQCPYLLVISRSILQYLSSFFSYNNNDNITSYDQKGAEEEAGELVVVGRSSNQPILHLLQQLISKYFPTTIVTWCARSVVAHERLLLLRDEPSKSLWNEVERLYPYVIFHLKQDEKTDSEESLVNANDTKLAMVYLEYALAHVHFERELTQSNSIDSSSSNDKGGDGGGNGDNGSGKEEKEGDSDDHQGIAGIGYMSLLDQSRDSSGLIMEITGAMGKRTKFQTKATAQYVVRAQSSNSSFLNAQQQQQQQQRQPQGRKEKPTLSTINENDQHQNHDGTEATGNNECSNFDSTNSTEEAERNGQEAGQSSPTTDNGGDMMVPHTDDTVLLEQIKFDDEAEQDLANVPLTILDQAIILGYCLVVKTKNPSSDDVLTGEEMLAYLARVLAVQHCHQQKLLQQKKKDKAKKEQKDEQDREGTEDSNRNESSLVDWMVYATALLERAWLEFDNTHTKERALLQLQALSDQHSNRLTLTQSTMKSITEDSSPVQDRLKYVHCIVYPPQWRMKHDLATRYARLGIVTSAAELFATVEDWDSVVECYKRAGKENLAKEVVERQLQNEATATPRMWTALGDITNEPRHYERAIELSNGRFAQAYISLGKYHFENGEIELAAENYRKALQLRPLIPNLWFKVGTISMQLEQWDKALRAFSEVVQQEPTEHEAWANVAAIHLHNKNPAAAYPALSESLKQNRNNWRVWVSKLYTCLDLEKYDEAIQACNMLLDFQRSQSAKGVPPLEEKCVRAIVGGTLERYRACQQSTSLTDDDTNVGASRSNNAMTMEAALESARRSLSRVHDLLERMSSSLKDPWVFETMAYFQANMGHDEKVRDNLFKEYRSLQSARGWEKDNQQVEKICQVVSQIVRLSLHEGLDPIKKKEECAKSKFLLSGVIQRVQKSRQDPSSLPDALTHAEALLKEVIDQMNSI